MSLLEQLQALDEALLAAFATPEQLAPEQLEQRLAERARLLQLLIDTEMVDAEQVETLVARSRLLKQQAEQTRQQLADKLAQMQKGRRSVGAYQKIKHQE